MRMRSVAAMAGAVVMMSAAADRPWLVVNEDNDHFFKLDSSRMTRKGLVAPGGAFPGADRPLQDGCVSYHMRTGRHNLTLYDWVRYMDFADRNGWRGAN